MYPKKLFDSLFLAVVILFSFHPISSLYGEGQMTLSPTHVLVGSFQSVRLEFTVGASGLQTGGGIRLELPVSGLETEPYFRLLQWELVGLNFIVIAIYKDLQNIW